MSHFWTLTSGTNTNGSNGSNTGGSGSGTNTGGNTGTSGTGGNSGSVTSSNPRLTINRTGSGTATVTVGGNAVTTGSELEAGTEVSLSVTPAEGATPTATLNGNSVALTENDGVYTGSFTMPSANATLTINSGSTSGDDDDSGDTN